MCMKLGMASVTFRNKSIREVFEYAHAAGVEGIEWGICANHMELMNETKADEIKALSEQYGIQIFSLGSYCRMDSLEEALQAIETARMMKAPIIRIWAGRLGSLECSGEEYVRIIDNTKRMAVKAKEYGINIGFEYHTRTLTDTAKSAVKLVQDIGMDNVGLYWQPSGSLSKEENLREFQTVMPYLTGNLHVHNHTVENGYRLLSEIEENIKAYYEDVKDRPYRLLIEFVRDGSLESLIADANFLKTAVIS